MAMPHYSYLATALKCPHCEHIVRDIVFFQWGRSAGYAPRSGDIYHLGDEIRWYETRDGSVLPWVYFWERREGNPADRGSNHGDPAIRNLLVRDPAQFYHDASTPASRCAECAGVLGGAIVEIRDNILRDARIYLPGEIDDGIDIFVLDPSGLVKPMPEWNDYPLGIVYGLLPSADGTESG